MCLEKRRLENIAQDYSNPLQAKEVSAYEISYCFDIFKRFYQGGSILEMGPAEGVMTRRLIKYADYLEIVEGSDYFSNALKKEFPNLSVNCCLFEEFKPTRKYDAIVMGHVLEHVESPVEILKLAKTWLKTDTSGIIFAAVPNSHSIHRQAAVKMGLLDSEKSMSEADVFHGHRRVYNLEEFLQEFVNAGLKVVASGGYWLKPLSNQQIKEQWNKEMIEAFMQLGEQYPEIAGDIYVAASL
ncbi:class I SAM-dependent methyltransferase [Helicobacter sp. MIT 11-5569]|uniref:class I SAM-dependent methyltransferase n=1 Tax=Helicobacter sp. MIT 11-5569 TaxID=1548151 RepID=UPI00051FB325|nr:class I SAM-dependent methyltransferase [Helicobacter sp. MIT 11-5569]TLD81163.1 class I SAM-dependent methyltransferase [Helicobacter sp. MIT 11-5569]